MKEKIKYFLLGGLGFAIITKMTIFDGIVVGGLLTLFYKLRHLNNN